MLTVQLKKCIQKHRRDLKSYSREKLHFHSLKLRLYTSKKSLEKFEISKKECIIVLTFMIAFLKRGGDQMKFHVGNYILKEIGGTIIAQSPMFLQFEGIEHLFTTRIIKDDEAKKELGELDMSVKNDEFPKHFEFLTKCVNISPQRCVFSHQVHSKNIKVVTSEDIGEPYWERKLREVDGLITNERGLFLVTTYADCMPILAYDPNNEVIGVAHSGWRGTLIEIAKELILKMNEEFNSSPQDIFVTVGPSIGPDSFEVGEDVAEKFFLKFGREVIKEFGSKVHVDLWKAVELTLKSVGVEHIEFSMIDTYKHTEYFYSYRKENTKKRFAAIIGLK